MEKAQILPFYNVVLIRYGEVWLKSQKVKMRMLRILINNIKVMLKKAKISFHKYQLSNDSSRILFFFKNEDIFNALEILSNAFGVYSISPALRTSNRIGNISQRAIEVGNYILKERDTFAIRVKRSGKQDYSSLDVARIVGEVILENFKQLNLKVNLTSPKKVIFIEIRGDFSYIFSEIIKSKWGGLPIETQKNIAVMDIGRVNDLISGFLLMKRGCLIYPVLFEMTEQRDSINIWLSNWQALTKYIPFYNFILKKINLVEILKHSLTKIQNKKYICGICSLIRFDILSKIIEDLSMNSEVKVRAITDGLSLNNSTLCPDHVDLDSIALSHLFTNVPIFTPIIGLDLHEINDLINEISKNLRQFDYCELKPREQDFDSKILKELYESLKLNELIQQAIQKAEEIKIL